MILRKFVYDTVAFGLVAGIKAEVRAAIGLRVQFFECRHAGFEKQVACDFKFFGRAIALGLVPCIDFLHSPKVKKGEVRHPVRTSIPSANT